MRKKQSISKLSPAPKAYLRLVPEQTSQEKQSTTTTPKPKASALAKYMDAFTDELDQQIKLLLEL